MDTDTNTRKESIYELLNKFDFKEPVKVSVIFEDSDEDNGENKTEKNKPKKLEPVHNNCIQLEDIKKECKVIESIQSVPVIDFEDIQEVNENNALSTVNAVPDISKCIKTESIENIQIANTKSIQEENSTIANIKIPEFIKTEKIETLEIDSNTESRSDNNKIGSLSVIEKISTLSDNANKTKINEKAPNSNPVVPLSVIESTVKLPESNNKSPNAVIDIDIDSIITKAVQNANTYQGNQNDPKKRKLLEEARDAPMIKRTTNNANNSYISTTSSYNTTDIALTSESNSQMTKCVTGMLETVSEYIINIVRAYDYHMRNRLSKSKTESEKANCEYQFNRYKYYLFHLLFCTVENVILPHLPNKQFVSKFIQDTIKLGQIKTGFTQLVHIVTPLFMELIDWTKRKQAAMKKVHSIVEPDIAHNQKQDHPTLKRRLTGPPMSVHPPNTVNKLTPAQSGTYPHAFVSTNNNNVTPDPRLALPTLNQGSNQLANYNNRSYQNGTNQGPSANIVDESARNVILSYGPPSRQIRISIDQSSIPANCDLNNIAASDLLQSSNINQNQNYSHHLQKSNANSYLQQHQYTNDAIGLQTQFQPTPNNYYNSPCTSQVNQHQLHSKNPPPPYPDHNPNSVTSVFFQNQKSANATPQRGYNPLQPVEASMNHKLTDLLQRRTIGNNQYCDPVVQQGQNIGPPWQNHQQPTITLNQPVVNVQIEQQNSEMTRSRSTDSGFASPVYFNNSNEQTSRKDTTPTPVTLNVEGSCYTCGKATRQLCMGCFKRYYCSAPCQSISWQTHKSECYLDI